MAVVVVNETDVGLVINESNVGRLQRQHAVQCGGHGMIVLSSPMEEKRFFILN
jgi:hypothetical protein